MGVLSMAKKVTKPKPMTTEQAPTASTPVADLSAKDSDLDEFERVLAKRSRSLCAAIHASERLTQQDYAVRINAK